VFNSLPPRPLGKEASYLSRFSSKNDYFSVFSPLLRALRRLRAFLASKNKTNQKTK
jgi:hypothetical protein